jgi:hypothetical protein
MTDAKTRRRAQSILGAMLTETKNAIAYLHSKRPRVFGRGFANMMLNNDRLAEVQEKIEIATREIQGGNVIDWDALEDVGLTGGTLEWKADFFYSVVGRQKPDEQQAIDFKQPSDELSYPDGKPIWSRLFKYLKSLLTSLINGIKSNSKVRLALDFIKEYLECVEAPLKFVQSGEEFA